MTDDQPTERSQAYRDDRAHVFHSWSAQKLLDPLVVAGAEGSRFWTDDGRTFLDFSSQMININIGHQHPKVVAAIKAQADVLCTIAPGHANDKRGELARRAGRPRAGRPRHGLLHQRRSRGHRERGPHGPGAHRAAQGPVDLPQLPRRHQRRDHDDR